MRAIVTGLVAGLLGWPCFAQVVTRDYGRLPLAFEANVGQTDDRVDFLARVPGYVLFLTPGEAVFVPGRSFGESAAARIQRTVLRMRVVGANAGAAAQGIDELPGKHHYFIGNDPSRWRTGVPSYAAVRYTAIRPGIDLVYHGNGRRLEYDFVVARGVDPAKLELAFEGAEAIEIGAAGDLLLHTAGGEFRLQRPSIRQEIRGNTVQVSGDYELRDGARIGFRLGAFDGTEALVIDPIVEYSTFLGGRSEDRIREIAVDPAGNALVMGWSLSPNFPTEDPLQDDDDLGGYDAVVTKLNPAGDALVFSTYFGGSFTDFGEGIALAATGDVYVSGRTTSDDFPTVNPAQGAHAGGGDAFVAKLPPDGQALIYSTYLGGRDSEFGYAIAVDAGGSAYLVGTTFSDDFPVKTPIQGALGGDRDAFVTKLTASGSGIVYSTFLGGSTGSGSNSGEEAGLGIAVDGGGSAHVAGITSSTNFPTANPLQPTHAGGGLFFSDAFVAKLTPTGTALVYSTYFGGSGDDVARTLVVDPSGAVAITGETQSPNLPTQNPFQSVLRGNYDAFVTQLSPAADALVYSTYLGGDGAAYESGRGIALDATGHAYVTGRTSATGFPTLLAFQPNFAGGFGDAFVTKLTPAGNGLVWSTYLGGSRMENGGSEDGGIAIDAQGNVFVAGSTDSKDFPTADPVQDSHGGRHLPDGFVVKITEE